MDILKEDIQKLLNISIEQKILMIQVNFWNYGKN